MCLAIHNSLKNRSYDIPFFKGIVVLPLVGHVVHIWKRCILSAELQAIGVNKENVKSLKGSDLFNHAGQKVTEIHHFDSQSFAYGRVGDIACIILGLALPVFFPILATVGYYGFLLGAVSLVVRGIVVPILDTHLQIDLIHIRPTDRQGFDLILGA